METVIHIDLTKTVFSTGKTCQWKCVSSTWLTTEILPNSMKNEMLFLLWHLKVKKQLFEEVSYRRGSLNADPSYPIQVLLVLSRETELAKTKFLPDVLGKRCDKFS